MKKIIQVLKILNDKELVDKFISFQNSEKKKEEELKHFLGQDTDAAFLQKLVNTASTNRNVLIEMTKLDGTKIVVRTLPDRTKDGIRQDMTPERAEQLLSELSGASGVRYGF